MSDKMFDEVGVGVLPGKPYKFGDWKTYAVHDENNVKGFFGEYRWLSNFYECMIEYEGLQYVSTENAYQAAKVQPEHREWIATCAPYVSKSKWKTLPKISETATEWDARKYDVMLYLTLDKYNRHNHLRNKLLATGDRYLEETNHWNDRFWGVDIKLGGQNNLGKILMDVRKFWKSRQ